MKRKIISLITYTALAVIGIGVFTFVFWLYSVPDKAVTVSPDPIPVLTKVVKEDKTCAILGYNRCAILKFTRCKHTRATGRVVITLVGKDSLLTLPPSTDSSPRKCDTDIRFPLPIPPQTVAGVYHFHFRVTYQINPITSQVVDLDTEEFTVQ